MLAVVHLWQQDGSTPMHAACEAGSNGVVFALINAGASVHAATSVSEHRCDEVLADVCARGHVSGVTPCVDCVGHMQSGDTPLSIATRLHHTEVIATLHTAGATA